MQTTISEDPCFIDVNGVRLEAKFHTGTRKNAPVLIFLHEGLGCVEMWGDFPAQVTAATGYSSFIFSRQGYGRSDACELPRPLTYMHNEAGSVLPAVLKAAGIENYILIGHSDGGSIALIYAGSQPGKGLKAVITMAPHIFCEAITIDAIEQAARAYSEGDKLQRGLSKYHGENTDCAFWGWNKAWLDPEFKQWNIEAFLPAIEVPQLVIQGDADPYGSLAQVQGIADQSGGAVSVCMIPDCGHAPYKEKSRGSLEAIAEFLIAVEGDHG